ncbi:RNA polymerase sigma factor [Singulisphaera acidiphila]|uniref:RNA polymerase sigma factor, sigma-70 family n=1 Tax=Singulisphaera acidiphila (strain ATCC BAA-1392 / DSM 18658 / VKM B-2454 / MOB10) TaxID=886293 RepID=L0DLS6_SINAD|nr:sigma-70 family RNA polymerase sigma factor [Singulisphaera acidiphila]AGA30202.1 RNA polymerase sigma factor, sigma-70 family [Singulisphaera acidiphila DSM 18658]
MDDAQFASTNLLLLERLRNSPRDEAAWNELVRGYAPAIRRWCRAWRLQDADVDDVTQTVLLKLSRLMATFHYDPSRSFRGYLKTLTNYAVRDALKVLSQRGLDSGDPALLDWLGVVDTRNDLARCLEHELRRDLFREAAARVSQRTDLKTWNAFHLLVHERLAGQDVADRTGMSLAAVYMAKSRVLKMMREEVRSLSHLLADPDLSNADRGLLSNLELPPA